MKRNFTYYLFLLIYFAVGFSCTQDPHLLVVIPTYHNKDYCIQNIKTLAEQTYDNWNAIVIVDGMPQDDDGTYALLESYITDHNLSDRIKLIQNTERRLALYNIYTTIHTYAEDDSVIVLYDGDDFFYTPQALERIAREYRKPSTWFTYGQYINYPANTIGNCRSFPAKIQKGNDYRSYDWIASHPRTFYAWLFKRIKLQDLLHNGKFYPMAWDVAFLPMLEMAGAEHIVFIPDILYAYRHHQNNDYAQNITLQLCLEKIIRSQNKYSKLTQRTSTNKRHTAVADLIIYSKDRPLQLEALLESIEYNVHGINAIKVIYKASNPAFEKAFLTVKTRFKNIEFINEAAQKKSNFKKITLKTIEQCTSKYIILAVDDNLVTAPIDIAKTIAQLESTKAFGAFFRMGLNIHYSVTEQNNKYYETPPLVQLDDEMYAWQFGADTNYKYTYCSGEWHYPTSIDMSLFRKDDLLSELNPIQFNSPNTLEGNWSCTIPKKMRKVGICFRTSKCINVPLNSVKNGQPLPNMNISVQELLQKYNQGYVLNWQPLMGKTFESVHVLHTPSFKKQ
jgi:glycosyltransferase involved in cell wall biosynthesis